MQTVLRANSPPRRARLWMFALTLGAGLGALILGGGGRLAMRGITLWEGRTHLLSLGGTLSVIGYGVAFGVLGACLRAALDVAAERWVPVRAPGSAPSAVFAIVCLALAVLLLTPLTVHRLVLFPPLVVLYVIALEACWRRWRRALG